MQYLKGLCVVAACIFASVTGASAWHVSGNVYCDANGSGVIDEGDLPLAGVQVVANGPDDFDDFTDQSGHYHVELNETSSCYTVFLHPTSIPADASIIEPPTTYTICTTEELFAFEQDWLIRSEQCAGLCWLTGGGVKFEQIIGENCAEHGPKISFGGNVHPSCSAEPGEGGQWNHIDHVEKLHFQGRAIPTVSCGNVPGIPPGSESPVTPVNFIEYTGTGTLKGIKGNKADFGEVHFFARAEDRNEPGSNGAKDGALIDRYFLHVYSDPSDPVGSTLYLFDIDGDPSTVDPKTITGGNMQMHYSSCE